jgi:hypothetical protein
VFHNKPKLEWVGDCIVEWYKKLDARIGQFVINYETGNPQDVFHAVREELT